MMSYRVLARKYRPRTFHEVVGQEPAVKALVNALDRDQLHHAYLFTGTRGVGKTTLARILAACLNCERGVSSEPCGSCGACESIREGRFVDLIEVDAASRTGVDDTRDLLNNVQYLPSGGRFKVYLIDEVHMLSTSSFNALLKTLEEPPEHVKFLLATTEAKRIPITVLSRCLQINLRNISPRVIADQLSEILATEEVAFEPEALDSIARAAGGSMRDAQSITDQAIAHGGGTVTAADVIDMLGIAGSDEVAALLEALQNRDTEKLLDVGDELAARAVNLADVLAGLLRAFHDLAIADEFGNAAEPPLDAFQGKFAAEDLQLYYQITLHGSRDLQYAPDAKTGFDMTLLRLGAFEPMRGSGEGDVADGTSAGPEQAGGRAASAAGGVAAKAPAHATSASRATVDESAAADQAKAADQAPSLPPPEDIEVGREAPVVHPEVAETESFEQRAERAYGEHEPKQRQPSQTMAATDDWTEMVDAAANTNAETSPPPPADETSSARSAGGDEPWHEILERIAPQGLQNMILANANLVERSPSRWVLLIDKEREMLLNDKQRRLIADMASRFEGHRVEVQWRVGQTTEETPWQRQQRIEEETQQRARESLMADPAVQLLMQDFDATLKRVDAPGAPP